MEGETNGQKTDVTWQKNANSQVVLDSIFAALAAVWITVAYQNGIASAFKFIEVTAALFSFFLFALSAEGTITAYDEKDVVKFVYYLLWYNIAVILIGIAIGLFIYVNFESHIVNRVNSILVLSFHRATGIVISAGYFILLVGLLSNGFVMRDG